MSHRRREDPIDPTEELRLGLLSAAPEALLAVNPNGRIAFANAEAARLFGWSIKQLVGRRIQSIIPDHMNLCELVERAQGGRGSASSLGAERDLRARRRDGTEFPAQVSFSGFSTAEGDLVAAVVRDASELRRVERRFRDVLESAPDAMVGVDADGCIEFLNSQAERLFGWPAAELIGQNIQMLVPEAMLDRHVKRWSTYLADLRPRPFGVGSQLLGRRRDGTTFPAEMSLSAVGGDQGRAVLAAVRDVTARLGLEADRQQVASPTTSTTCWG